MNILIYSDLHLEYWDFDPCHTPVDLVVLAGDIHTSDRALAWIRQHFAGTPVVYVPGNHEFYGADFQLLVPELQTKTQDEDIYVLDQNAVQFGDTLILGTTLWTDFKLSGDVEETQRAAERCMADYHHIRNGSHGMLRAQHTADYHAQSLRWLESKLLSRNAEKVVVVSHHAPSERSVTDEYKGDITNGGFASHLDDLIQAHNIDLWIHGHMHSYHDYHIGKTRVVCNPRGYPRENHQAFNPQLIVTI